MRLLLIRHGETVDNVAGIYAGTTDSPLTNHGVLQANRLGAHLSATDVKISHIFSSDLQRAFKTAEAIRSAQSPSPDLVVQLPLLQEQDFGFFEGKKFSDRSKDSNKSARDTHLDANKRDPGFQDVESKELMRIRVDTFIDLHLLGYLKKLPDERTVAVVAHGIILSHLWRAILRRFQPGKVTMASGVGVADRGIGLEYLGGWSNTGYLELEIKPVLGFEVAGPQTPSSPVTLAAPRISTLPQKPSEAADLQAADAVALPPDPTSSTLQIQPACTERSEPSIPNLLNMTLVVKAVNHQEHLKGLKKTRGGIGSLKHDSSQKTVDSFFKKRRLG